MRGASPYGIRRKAVRGATTSSAGGLGVGVGGSAGHGGRIRFLLNAAALVFAITTAALGFRLAFVVAAGSPVSLPHPAKLASDLARPDVPDGLDAVATAKDTRAAHGKTHRILAAQTDAPNPRAAPSSVLRRRHGGDQSAGYARLPSRPPRAAALPMLSPLSAPAKTRVVPPPLPPPVFELPSSPPPPPVPDGFGSAADIAAHRRDATCWSHFDFGYVEEWAARATPMCAATPAAISAGVSSSLTCRGHVDAHLPPPTAPHVLCDATDVIIDSAALLSTACLASRPGYKCDGPAVHYAFPRGALSGACDVQSAFVPSAFPRDFLMDMLGGGWAGGASPADVSAAPLAAAPITLFVTREREEHANLFHATTDLLNAFVALAMLGIVDGRSGSREGMANVSVVLLDEQEGPFEDAFWGKVYSPAHPLQRVSGLRVRGRVRYPRAVFVPPGYSNLLLSAVGEEGDCHAPAGSHLFHAYRRFVLRGLGLSEAVVRGAAAVAADGSSGDGDPSVLRATFVSRRPYNRHHVDHARTGRQVDNEEALLAALNAVPGVRVQRLDFALLEVEEQIAAVAVSDVLIGMHGAALTHVLYLPPHAGVLELWPKPGGIWRCFEHAATLAGLYYARWSNVAFPVGYREDAGGDYTTVDVAAAGEMFRGVVTAVAARRKEAAAAAAAREPWPR